MISFLDNFQGMAGCFIIRKCHAKILDFTPTLILLSMFLYSICKTVSVISPASCCFVIIHAKLYSVLSSDHLSVIFVFHVLLSCFHISDLFRGRAVFNHNCITMPIWSADNHFFQKLLQLSDYLIVTVKFMSN